jgi:integrase
MKTLFQTGARVSEFANIKAEDLYFDEQMLLIAKAKGGKSRYVPILPELTQELRTYLGDRTTGYLFETNRHTPAVSSNSSKRRQPRPGSPSGSIRICCATRWRPRFWNGACPLSRFRSSSDTPNLKRHRSMRSRPPR